jgi:hypothetical protein
MTARARRLKQQQIKNQKQHPPGADPQQKHRRQSHRANEEGGADSTLPLQRANKPLFHAFAISNQTYYLLGWLLDYEYLLSFMAKALW